MLCAKSTHDVYTLQCVNILCEQVHTTEMKNYENNLLMTDQTIQYSHSQEECGSTTAAVHFKYVQDPLFEQSIA